MSKIEKLILFFIILWCVVFVIGFYSGLNAPTDGENKTANMTDGGDGVRPGEDGEDTNIDGDDDENDHGPPALYNVSFGFENIGNETGFSVSLDENDINLTLHLDENETIQWAFNTTLPEGDHLLLLDFNILGVEVKLDFSVGDEDVGYHVMVDEPKANIETLKLE